MTRQQFEEKVVTNGNNAEFKFSTGAIPASASLNMYLDTILPLGFDVTKYKTILITMNTSDTVQHTFSGALQSWRTDFSAYSKTGSYTGVASANQYYGTSALIQYTGNRLLFIPTNGDTLSSHNYNVLVKFNII